jgi:GntR family transcriptional regulator, transcriptional repressor for pyruvate dehydrogenase complex
MSRKGARVSRVALDPQPLGLPALARRETPSAELTRHLLRYLLSGDLAPGDKIPSERQLAQALGVGRSGVREAVKSLDLLGLLHVRQGDGTYLSRSPSDLLPQVIEWGLLLGERSIQDLAELRMHLEIVAAGLAADRRSDEQLARVQEVLAEMEAAGDDLERYIEADIAFHLAIAEASGNTAIRNVVFSLQSLLSVWAARVIRSAGETETSLAMHTPIVAAIEAGDEEAARRGMAAHMERANRRLRDALEQENAERVGEPQA